MPATARRAFYLGRSLPRVLDEQAAALLIVEPELLDCCSLGGLAISRSHAPEMP